MEILLIQNHRIWTKLSPDENSVLKAFIMRQKKKKRKISISQGFLFRSKKGGKRKKQNPKGKNNDDKIRNY